MSLLDGLSAMQKKAVEIIDDDLEIIACAGAGKTGVVTRRIVNKVDNKKYVIIMDDDEMDEFEKNFQQYKELKALFINQDVLLTTSQEK